MKKALFPGSFDPITLGHLDIVRRAKPLFDEIVIAVGENDQKKYLFSLEQRIEWLEQVFQNEPQMKVMQYRGLTVNFAKDIGANYLLRGLRNASDFD